ncbi:hypothetical protein HOA55_03735 [archaeon]|jgi:hypothetical protein|nr:hypothetical protein [archaeon]MBT3577317.1 hypothetical protein [archaeon]MBT6820439.1 hypothetical protein [archaeon]MBT6956264.1 hypothetical protein [archaeon]MBT7025253.1 hypothetical protein [archaeon]
MEKRGQQLTIGTLIIIVLGIAVLVFLIYGFSTGWGNLWGKVTSYGGEKENVDTIRQACIMACQQGASNSFCIQKRNLIMANDKTTTGSCLAFAERNPTLGMEGCDLCSGPSEECISDGNPDPNCVGEGIVVMAGNLPVYALESDVETINGTQNLAKIKSDLNIPDKFCYWNATQELYSEKCPNMSKAEIKEIFDAKKNYREEHNSGWAEINYDWDYCVDIIFNYTLWDKKREGKSSAAGFFDTAGKKFYLSPYVTWTKEHISRVMYHEGLHSMQNLIKISSSNDSHVGEGKKYAGGEISKEQAKPVWVITDRGRGRDFFEESKAKSYCKTLKSFIGGAIDIVEEKISKLKRELVELGEDDGSKSLIEAKEKELNITVKEYSLLRSKNSFIRSNCYEPHRIQQKSYFENLITKIRGLFEDIPDYKKNATLIVDELEKLYVEAYKISTETTTKGYVGSKAEIDPRLSEVQRWWLDQTSPKCEIIETPETAKKVLDKFLSGKDLDAYYFQTHRELSGLILQYKGTEYEKEVYDSLYGRLPGIARSDTPVDDGIDFA